MRLDEVCSTNVAGSFNWVSRSSNTLVFVSAFKNESHRIITHVDSVKHVGVNSEEGAT